MKIYFTTLLFITIIFSQDAKSFFSLKGNWKVTQKLYNGDERPRVNKIVDLFEGNGLLSYWYDENNTFLGSDVRTYEANEDRWKMTWFDGMEKQWKKTRYLKRTDDHYTAVSDFEDKRGRYKERITFFNITKNSYEWRMEYLRENWKNWKTVMSYKSIRIKD